MQHFIAGVEQKRLPALLQNAVVISGNKYGDESWSVTPRVV